MISRNEYLYIKQKASKMRDVIFDYENRGETYATWKIYQNMSQEKKDELHQAWREYYEDARNGYYGLIYHLAALAFKQRDLPLLESLIKQMQSSTKPYHKKPSSVDPSELKMEIDKYFEYRHKLEEMDKIVEEYMPIYEKSKAESTL